MKKLSITITVLAMAGGVQVASASNFCAAVNDLNPVGYWQFEQDWTDRSGNGNTLTPFALSEGPVTFTPGPGHAGMPGDAADFRHGGGQRGAYVDTGAGDPLTLSGAGGYTINAWVSNDEDLGSWGFIAVERDAGWCCGPNGWNYGLAYYRSLGGPQSGYKTWIQGSNASVEPVPIIDADWHMLTVSATLPSGTASIYLDGVFAGSHATGGASMAGDGEYFQVGNPINPITNAAVPENYTSNDLNGRIDELAVFGYALSAAQISNLYAAAFIAGGPCPEPPEPGIIPSTDVVVEDVLGTTFSSESNETYNLQSTPDLVSSNFSDTGAIAIGNGGDMTLYDPTGPSTSKNYRVKQE